MAYLAWHDKAAPDSAFLRFFPSIRRGATDERNFVKKAVSWALRNIGKRNPRLRSAALREARALRSLESKAARWGGAGGCGGRFGSEEEIGRTVPEPANRQRFTAAAGRAGVAALVIRDVCPLG